MCLPPGIYYYKSALCLMRWLVIRAGLAENDGTAKRKDERGGKEGDAGMKQKGREVKEREICKAQTDTPVQPDSVVGTADDSRPHTHR